MIHRLVIAAASLLLVGCTPWRNEQGLVLDQCYDERDECLYHLNRCLDNYGHKD